MADVTVIPRGSGSVTVLWRQNGRARAAIMSSRGEYTVWERGRRISSGSSNIINRGYKNDGGFRDVAARAGLYQWITGRGSLSAMERRFSGQYASGYSVTGQTASVLSPEQVAATVLRARGIAGGDASAIVAPPGVPAAALSAAARPAAAATAGATPTAEPPRAAPVGAASAYPKVSRAA